MVRVDALKTDNPRPFCLSMLSDERKMNVLYYGTLIPTSLVITHYLLLLFLSIRSNEHPPILKLI